LLHLLLHPLLFMHNRSPIPRTLLYSGLIFYLLVYTFEGAVRYWLNLAGADSFIFARDVALMLPVLLVGGQQLLERRLHPAYLIYFGIVVLHGTVMMLNIGSFPAVVFGAKGMQTFLVGAVCAPLFMQPGRRMLWFVGILWLSLFIGVFLDKYQLVSWPWEGMSTTIGDVSVEISRDWEIEGDDKRAAGMTRSSIHAATIVPLLGLMLVAHLRALPLRIIIALATAPVILWTTQKGALLAYLIVLVVLAVWRNRPIPAMRWGFCIFLLLAILLPVLLPGYYMAQAGEGGFSNMSFNLRVEMMWPEAWEWVSNRQLFPFGVGLGGISGAQQLYTMQFFNAADNLFVFMYACFGVMAFVYLGYVTRWVVRTPANGGAAERHALAVLLFVAAYGCVLSMVEDQMASLFLGAVLSWISYDRYRQVAATPASQPTAGGMAIIPLEPRA
jgi:hypothetical protein